MDIKEYSYILAVVNCGSISEAARRLYISQPSLSIYLHSLEDRIGVNLFYKDKGIIYLTDVGKRYVDYARQIVTLDEAFGRELQEIKSITRGEVVLGVTATRGMRLLRALLPAFKEKYPGIMVKIKEGNSINLEEMVRTHQVDIAVLNHPFTQDDLEYTVLNVEEIVVIIPAHYEVNSFAKPGEGGALPWMDMAKLGEQPFILLHKGQRMRQIADTLFEKSGIHPPILWELSSAATAYQLSVSGLGLSIVAASYFGMITDPKVKAYSVSNPPLWNNVVAAYADKKRLSHAALALLEVLEQTY